jgi:type I restriction enzyme, S subunit
MGKYRGYEKHKDSGVEWLGEIPEHWNVKRLKNMASCNDEALGENTSPDYEMEYVDISSVDLISGITHHENMIFDKAPSRARRKVKDGDTIISTVRTYLKSIAAIKEPPSNLIVSTGFAVIRPKSKINPDYIGYLLQTEGFIGDVVSNSVGVSYPAINSTVLISLPVVEPTLEEQQSIAHFLDRKTSQIDALIAKKEALLEKLDEKRTALISHAVTKGLDPNVPMKDSGVEWLGEIPDHWNVKRLNFLAKRIGDGIHSTPEYVDNSEYHFINGNNLIKGKIVINDSTKCVSKEEFNKYNLNLDKRTLLLSINGTIGNVAFYKNEPVMLGKSAAYIVLNSDIEINFAYYFLLSQNTKNYFFDEVTGTTIFNLSLKSIKNIFFTHSSLEEQKTIARYLERKTSEIDQQKVKVKEAITLLKEYRTALITNAVTGKIDVRQVSTPRHKKSLLEVCAILEETHEDFPDVDENLLPLDDIEL